MLTKEQNARITLVGSGTPMGNLMRRYWHPIAASVDLNDETPTKEVRLLGEDLVIYRDAKGTVGCIEPSCAHRKANLSYGIPEENGIRCAYHGWVFNEKGACMEQPSEPEGSRFKDKVTIKAYPAQDVAGLIFVYMGPQPAPILPMWDLLAWTNVTRSITTTMLPCNWLQCQENSLDPLHFQWLHRYYGGWAIGRKLPADERDDWYSRTLGKGRDHIKIGFDRFEHGVIKRRLLEGEDEDDEYWKTGHPILFPNILRVGRVDFHSFQFRIPVDDTHTLHLAYSAKVPEHGTTVPVQETVPHQELPLYEENGRIVDTYVIAQDQLAWVIQGPLMDRTTEALGATDIGIIMYRKMLEENISIVEDGGDPMNVHRTAPESGYLPLSIEHCVYPDYQPQTPESQETRGEGGAVELVQGLK
jgi:5,5'-dehydrodivanillate O-demethylase